MLNRKVTLIVAIIGLCAIVFGLSANIPRDVIRGTVILVIAFLMLLFGNIKKDS